MRTAPDRRREALEGLPRLALRLAAATFVGALLGIVCLWWSPLWAFGALLGGGFIVAALKRPELALLGILVCTSSIVFESTLPLVPIGVGSLHISDLLLLGLLGLILARWVVEGDFEIVRTPLDRPLLCFYGVTLASTILAVLRGAVGFEIARRALRVVSYYLTFFLATNLLRERRQFHLLLNGLFLLASIVAVAMVSQFVLGESVAILPGRVETLKTQGTSYQGITRILPPGQSLVLVGFIAASTTLIVDGLGALRGFGLLRWVLLGLALLLTFNRSYWVAGALALVLVALLARGEDRQRLVELSLVAALVLSIVFLSVLAEPESRVAGLLAASLQRLGTLTEAETLQESSLQWRYVENRYAVAHIADHPLIGAGLGAQYRPVDPRVDTLERLQKWDATRYMHNGHLWLMVQSGLLGYFFWLWTSLAFLVRGFKGWRYMSDSLVRGSVLGFTLAFVGVLFVSITSPLPMEWFWTPVIGLMMGVSEAALREGVVADRPGGGS
jgi:hypothetical protein